MYSQRNIPSIKPYSNDALENLFLGCTSTSIILVAQKCLTTHNTNWKIMFQSLGVG
uniref:Uncharacterized protein n=1 Tax=Arundo donax TaxID=35708 RepID=A0A0A9H605_ARUDO